MDIVNDREPLIPRVGPIDMLLQRLPQSDAEQEARHGVVPVAANQGGVLGWLTPKGAAPAPAPAPAHANHAAFKKQGPLQA